MLRSLRVEVSKILGFEAIGILWDISAFYDSIDLALLIPLALERHFNPWLLSLALKVHLGPRAFKEGRFISGWFESSGTSLLAGCLTSCGLTKPLLYDMLDALHRDYRPITIKTWIDDIFQLHTSRKEITQPHAKKAALQLVALARRKRLQISSKSSITSSDPELAQRIQKDLAAEGIHLQVENSSKDLGVDFAGGGRRRIPVQQLRFLSVCQSAKQVAMLGKHHTKQARRLVQTAVKSRFYGFAAMGASPSMCKRNRAQVCNASGVRRAGRCATTALSLANM